MTQMIDHRAYKTVSHKNRGQAMKASQPSAQLRRFTRLSILAALLSLTSCDQEPTLLSTETSGDSIWLTPGKAVPGAKLALSGGETTAAKQPVPIMELLAEQVCAGISFRDSKDSIRVGTKFCAGPCTESGQKGCQTTSQYPAVDLGSIDPYAIKVGAKVANIEGQYTPDNYYACTFTGEQNCTSTVDYLPLVKTILNPGNIKRDVAIGSKFVGAYPSKDYPLAAKPPAGQLPLTNDVMLEAISSGKTYYLYNGSGELSTVTGDIRLHKNNIKAGYTVYGVKGEATAQPAKACSTTGQTSCNIAGEWLSLKPSDISSAVIKKGAKILGITGTYPSQVTPLEGSSIAIADLNLTSYAQLSSEETFEYFGPDGKWYHRTGNAKLKPDNIAEGKTILGVTGTVKPLDPSSLSAVDLRVKIAKPDGYGNGWLSPTTWCNTKAECLTTYWRDETSKVSGSGCTEQSKTCIFRNLLQHTDWAFPMDAALTDWENAGITCRDLDLNGNTDWRLPTQKEAMQSAAHGMILMGVFTKAYFKEAPAAPNLWTSTTITTGTPPNPYRALYSSAMDGFIKALRSDNHSIACVRSDTPQ